MKTNEAYKTAVDSTRGNFIKFIDVNYKPADITDHDIKDIDWLAQRVALNLFYYPDHVSTAKSDYIMLLALLKKKGLILQPLCKNK